jgi:hypothetical protein
MLARQQMTVPILAKIWRIAIWARRSLVAALLPRAAGDASVQARLEDMAEAALNDEPPEAPPAPGTGDSSGSIGGTWPPSSATRRARGGWQKRARPGDLSLRSRPARSLMRPP